MSLQSGAQLLRDRYRVLGQPISSDAVSDSYVGVDDYDNKYLIKVWPFSSEAPDDLQRALWDSELRTLYRVGSSPGAEDSILVIRDAGLDRDARCFAMVLEARGPSGYETLTSALAERGRFPWLSNRDVRSRRDLWLGFQRLAEGLRLLHEQHVLHRHAGADTVFFNSQLGPASLRLGGFEWSVRLGVPHTKAPPPSWSSPPEFFAGGAFGYRPETDWYAFGMLAVRCLLNVESYANNGPIERNARVLREVERATRQLSEIERSFLLRIIAPTPEERLTRGHEIRTAIQDITFALERGADPLADERPLVVVINPGTNHDLLDRAREVGFVPDPSKPQDAFNPGSVLHEVALTSFIQRDMANAQLYAVPDAHFYILVGANLILMISQFEYTDRDSNSQVRTWDFAFCYAVSELRRNDGGSACVDLPPNSVVVRTKRQVLTDRGIRQNARSWEQHLPTIDRAVQLRANLALFHEFIRCTNQLELLIRDSEIFSYRVASRSKVDAGVEKLVIAESPRTRPVMSFCQIEGGLAEFLLREVESNKRDCRIVVLTGPGQDALGIDSTNKADCWTVDSIDPGANTIELRRVIAGREAPPVPDVGHLRTWGMFGQVALIRRRKRAIDRIEKHSYLLRSLSAPGQVFMDTGSTPLPVPLRQELVDEAKQAAIEDILRVRPIYALQGPPGTGKTTLVAHLLRQIFEDDPVAQVLITAQAHGAVDVLRAKVRDEAFRGIPEERQPLAVRLGVGESDSGPEEGSVEEVSLRILETAKRRLSETNERSNLQDEWLQAVGDMITSLRTWTPDRASPDFCEIVKRGASVTYCTTSAGDLEVLAESTQSFDWAIIEEAGKCHGFDLALPLQAGHRWLLIGDHKQLPPYRFKDYRDGIDHLEEAVQALGELPERAANMLDFDWVRSWSDRTPAERAAFKEYARTWLNTFERVFAYCSTATGVEKLTHDKAEGAAAGMLSRQHRMHPTIGDLISIAYYGGNLVNRTVDEQGRALARVQHAFVEPASVTEKAIVWIDTPWAAREARAQEQGPLTGHPRYTNPAEVEALEAFLRALKCKNATVAGPQGAMTLAVLSPYNQQVALINKRLQKDVLVATGVSLKPNLRSRRRENGDAGFARVAHTVDSFQGNQADIIAVSLVRNNIMPPGNGLGFLEEAPRLNVLLSRAERLLILVGSWEFFCHQVSAVPVEDPQLPLWHWKKVISTLQTWFEAGRAARIELGHLR